MGCAGTHHLYSLGAVASHCISIIPKPNCFANGIETHSYFRLSVVDAIGSVRHCKIHQSLPCGFSKVSHEDRHHLSIIQKYIWKEPKFLRRTHFCTSGGSCEPLIFVEMQYFLCAFQIVQICMFPKQEPAESSITRMLCYGEPQVNKNFKSR